MVNTDRIVPIQKIDRLSLILDIVSQDQLDCDRRSDDDQRKCTVVRFLRGNDLFHRFDERSAAGIKNDRRNDQSAEVFDPAVAERMLRIRFLPGIHVSGFQYEFRLYLLYHRIYNGTQGLFIHNKTSITYLIAQLRDV